MPSRLKPDQGTQSPAQMPGQAVPDFSAMDFPAIQQFFFQERFAKVRDDHTYAKILAVLGNPTSFDLLADQHPMRQDVGKRLENQKGLGRSSLAGKLQELEQLELISIDAVGRVSLTESGRKFSTEIESVSGAISRFIKHCQSPDSSETSPEAEKEQKARQMLSRSELTRTVLLQALEESRRDALGRARVNPIALRLGLRPKQVQGQFTFLERYGLFDHNQKLTDIAIAWCNENAPGTSAETAKPAEARKQPKGKTQPSTKVLKSEPAPSEAGTPVKSRPARPARGTTSSESSKAGAATSPERSRAPVSAPQKPSRVAAPAEPAAGKETPALSTAPATPVPPTAPAHAATPVQPPARVLPEQTRLLISKVGQLITDVNALSLRLENPVIRPEDRQKLLGMRQAEAAPLVDTAVVLGKVHKAVTSAPRSLIRGNYEITLQADQLSVTFPGLQMPTRAHLAYLERTREHLPGSRTLEKAVSIPAAPSPETLDIITALKDPLLLMGRQQSALKSKLIDLRDKLEPFAYPEKFPHVDFSRPEQVVRAFKDSFRQEILSPFGILNEQALERVAKKSEDSIITSAARATLSIMDGSASDIVDAITVIERYGVTGDPSLLLNEIKQLRHIVHSHGLPLSSIREYNSRSADPVHTSLPAITDSATQNERFLFEAPEYPGISLTITRPVGHVFHRISEINTPSHPETESVLLLIRRFEAEQLNKWDHSGQLGTSIMPESFKIQSGVDVSSEFRPPSSPSGESWITDGQFGGQLNELRNASFLLKIRYRDFSPFIEISEMHATSQALTMVRAIGAEVLNSNKNITAQMISSESSLKLKFVHDKGDLQPSDDQIELAARRQNGQWVTALVGQLENGRMSDTYFMNLAYHPEPLHAGPMLSRAVQFDRWEQSLLQLQKTTPLRINSIATDSRGLTVQFSGASTLPFEKLLEGPKSVAAPGKAAAVESSPVPAVDLTGLIPSLVSDLSITTGTGKAVPELKTALSDIYYLSGFGRLDQAQATEQKRGLVKNLLASGELTSSASGLLYALKSADSLIALEALRIFGPQTSLENVVLLRSLQRIKEEMGFVQVPIETSDLAATAARTRSTVTTSRLLNPELEHRNYLLVDAPALQGRHMAPADLLANATYGIHIKWGFPHNAFIPQVTAIHIRPDCDTDALKQDLLRIHQLKLQVMNFYDITLAQGAHKFVTKANPSSEMRSLRAGEHFSDRFTGLNQQRQALWLTDGFLVPEKEQNSARFYSLKNDSFGMFVTRAPYSDIAIPRRIYFKESCSSAQQAAARALFRTILEYNVEQASRALIGRGDG